LKASAEVENRLLLYGAGWKRVSSELWESPNLRLLYPEILKISYQVIKASTTLLELARDQAVRLAPTDPVSAGLAAYLAQHVEEERGHDEWLLQDLAALGITPEAAQSVWPSPFVAGMVGAQHYWALHAHPVAILGYIAVLEGEPPEEGFFLDAARRSGLPETAFSTLRYHARVDRGHWQDMRDLLDALPLEPRHLSLIGLSILHTCGGMESAIKATLDHPLAKMAEAIARP
jgi:hypothetical protein